MDPKTWLSMSDMGMDMDMSSMPSMASGGMQSHMMDMPRMEIPGKQGMQGMQAQPQPGGTQAPMDMMDSMSMMDVRSGWFSDAMEIPWPNERVDVDTNEANWIP